MRYTYTVNSSNLEQSFVIPSSEADTTSLVVSVQTSSSDVTTEVYSLNTDYATLTSTSTSYLEIDAPLADFPAIPLNAIILIEFLILFSLFKIV